MTQPHALPEAKTRLANALKTLEQGVANKRRNATENQKVESGRLEQEVTSLQSENARLSQELRVAREEADKLKTNQKDTMAKLDQAIDITKILLKQKESADANS